MIITYSKCLSKGFLNFYIFYCELTRKMYNVYKKVEKYVFFEKTLDKP